jgi:hypothetical protein
MASEGSLPFKDLMMMTEMVLETLVQYTHLTWLITREVFIEFSRREISRIHFIIVFARALRDPSFLRPGIVRPAPNPPLIDCPRLPIQYIYSYPPYLEAVSSIRHPKTRRTVVTGTQG